MPIVDGEVKPEKESKFKRCAKCNNLFRYPPSDNKESATLCAWCADPPVSGETQKTAPSLSESTVSKDIQAVIAEIRERRGKATATATRRGYLHPIEKPDWSDIDTLLGIVESLLITQREGGSVAQNVESQVSVSALPSGSESSGSPLPPPRAESQNRDQKLG